MGIETNLRQGLLQGIQRKESLVYGLTAEGNRVRASLSELGREPVEFPAVTHWETLEALVDQAGSGATFVSDDLYFWLDGEKGTATLVRLHSFLEGRGSTLWLLGPEREVPDVLQRKLVRLSLPLPLTAELREAALEGEHRLDMTQFTSEDLEAWVAAARGLTLREWNRLLERLVATEAYGAFLESLQEEKTRLLKNSTFLELETVPEKLEHLGGLEVLKEWLQGRKRAFGAEAEAFGLPQPKGLLLLGIQGCGKSLSAKVIASMWNLPLARLDLGQLFRSKSSPEGALRDTLRTAEGLSPMVLWIDEIDKTFGGLDSGTSDALRRLFGSFITWLQEKQAPVFVVATANEVEGLPPELLRKGRFDEIFFVDLPDPTERRSIFEIHLSRHGRDASDFNVDSLVQQSEYFSGAEIAEVVVAGLYHAFAESRSLEQADLSMAVQETVPLFFTYEERIKKFREWAMERARNASRDKRVLDLFRTD